MNSNTTKQNLTLEQKIDLVLQDDGQTNWEDYSDKLIAVAEPLSHMINRQEQRNNVASTQQAKLFDKLLEELAFENNIDRLSAQPEELFDGVFDIKRGNNVMPIESLLHCLIVDSWQEGHENKFVVPVIMGITEAALKDYNTHKDHFHPNFYFTCSELMDAYGTEYQLSDPDAKKLIDFLVETTDPQKPWHKGHVMAFNAFIENFEKQENPPQEVYDYLYSEEHAQKASKVIQKWETMEDDITRPDTEFNRHQQKIYYQTLNNLNHFIQK